jgi:uncharacterized membrane protein YfcA
MKRRLTRLNAAHPQTFESRFLQLSCTYIPVAFIGFALTSYFVSHAYTPVFYVLVSIATGFYLLAKRTVRSANAGRPRRMESIGSRPAQLPLRPI